MVRRLWGGLAYVLLATLFVIAGLEIGLRLLAPVERFAFTPRMWDPIVGIRNRPGARGFITCPEYDMEFVINSRGLRDRDYPFEKPEGTSRVLCLGDSFTMGYGVHAAETYPKVLERRLAAEAAAAGTWEVMNAGVGGTGTAHQLAYYLHEGSRYQPDIVVLAVCANDFWDNMVSGLYELEEGRLERRVPAKALGWRLQRRVRWVYGLLPWLHRSHLWNKIRHAYAVYHAKRTSRGTVARSDKSQLRQRTFDLTRELLFALREACHHRASEFIVLIVPPLKTSGLEVDRMAALTELIRAEGVPCVDLRIPFAQSAGEGVPTNFVGDGHWTPFGHEIAAVALVDLFRERGLLGARPAAGG